MPKRKISNYRPKKRTVMSREYYSPKKRIVMSNEYYNPIQLKGGNISSDMFHLQMDTQIKKNMSSKRKYKHRYKKSNKKSNKKK